MNDYDDKDSGLPTDLNPIVREARKRFERCDEWESEWRSRAMQDVRFANGDAHNGDQWPTEIRALREKTNRPCLTLNLVRAHNKMISNEARKNKATVKYVGLGNGATQQMANVYQDIHRRIEYTSAAQDAYTAGRESAITAGIGYWRIVTDYVDEQSFDQEIYIATVRDPMMIFMDPDIKRPDGLDAKFAFVFDDLPKADFEEQYPGFDGKLTEQPLGFGAANGDWVTAEKIRVCEYFRRVLTPTKLIEYTSRGQRFTVTSEQFEALVRKSTQRKAILAAPTTRTRDSFVQTIEWFLIVGQQIVDQTIWPGKYIPIVRVIGEETVVEGRLDRKGHTRWMLDAQRMFNYNASAQVEFGALQTKSPWLTPIKAIEEFEDVWNNANVTNPSYLPYNHVDSESNPEMPIPPPQRIDPPNVSVAFQAGMENANNHIMMVSGQYQNQMSDLGNERTGAAINARLGQSATANFHFQDNYERALITSGKIILDLIPRVYDTKRVMQILADDGTEYQLEIDPGARQGLNEERLANGVLVRRCLNPLIGKFEVAASVGPSMDSRRSETSAAMTLVLTQAPDLIPILGDLLVKNLPFDGAEEAAQRLRRMIPKAALGEGPTPEVVMAQQQIQALEGVIAKLMTQEAKNKIKLVGKAEMRDIEAYRAETDRMKALGVQGQELEVLVRQLIADALQTDVGAIADQAEVTATGSDHNEDLRGETSGEAKAQPPVQGARKAPDGSWVLEFPPGSGNHFRVDGEAK